MAPMDEKKIHELAAQIRRDVIEMSHHAGKKAAHLGGGLSLCEILAVLYGGILNVDANAPLSPERDRVLIGKGHGALALYAALSHVGLIPREDIARYKDDGFYLSMHPQYQPEHGLESVSGSLGQALSLAGQEHPRVFVLLGDGECNEGSVWEAAASAAHYKLDNLVAILDNNRIQNDGHCRDILCMDDMQKKWQAFGWETCVVDGHDTAALFEALQQRPVGKPLMVIANTIKGKGVSFAEGDPRWHNAAMTQAQYEQAISEQERD